MWCMVVCEIWCVVVSSSCVGSFLLGFNWPDSICFCRFVVIVLYGLR